MGVAPGSRQRFVGWGEHPVWSPDGNSIAYFSVGGCAIREISPEGRAEVTLFDITSVADRCEHGVDLAWSPDGTELAALVSRDITSRKGVAAVYLVKADGSRARAYTHWLTTGWGRWSGLAWEPVS